MTFISFVIYGMATWRVASLLVNENGPFKMFRRVRELSGIEHDEDGNAYMIPDNVFAGILSCVWCCSIWIAFFWTLFWLLSPDISLKIATVFSFSTVAIMIDRYLSS